MSDPNDFQWLQTGGVLAFAGAVLWELRALRPVLTETAKVLSAMLERDRMRELLRAQRRGDDPIASIPTEVHDEVTAQVEDAFPLRKGGKPRTPAQGAPASPGLYGHHKRGSTHGER